MRHFIVLNFTLVVAVFGCTEQPSIPMKPNFEIVISDFYDGELVVKEGKLTRNVDGEIKIARFKLNSIQIKKIFDFVESQGVLELPKNYAPESQCDDMHSSRYKMTVTNGDRKIYIKIADCDYELLESFKANKVLKSIHFIKKIIANEKEVKNLPRSESLIL